MKKVSINIVMVLLAIVISTPIYAQIYGNDEVTKQSYDVENFDGIRVDGAETVILTQGDSFGVVVETDSNIQEYVTLTVKNNMLHFGFTTNKIKKYKILKFYVTAPSYKLIKVSGASDVNSANLLTGDNLEIIVSGASDIDLDINYKSIETKLSGASDVKLSGKAISSVIESSGASDFRGKELVTISTVVSASGASNCYVNATSNLNYQTSGASDVSYVTKPETVIIKKINGSENVKVFTEYSAGNHNDTTTVNVGNLVVTVVDGDTTQIAVGRHTLVVTEDGDVSWKRCQRNRFDGHWGGFELGINGYVTPDFNTNWGAEYDYLNLKYEKSIAVNLNIYEQNISLNKDKTVGLVTGLGFSWNNYRFSNNTFLSSDSSSIKGYYMEDVAVRKTKLTAMYLTIPLIFEVQTNSDRYFNRFHFAVGVIAKMRISTHTKIYFDESDKVYYLKDPETNQLLSSVYRTPNASSRNIVKNFDSFYLRPFKFDATARFGYGIVNLFVTYSLNTMFQTGRGPKLYPVTAGITLLGW